MTTVTVNASKKYDVLIDKGLLGEAGTRIRQVCGGEKAFIITDNVVNSLYADRTEESLKSAGYSVERFIFANGEHSKNIGTYIGIINALAMANLTRSDVVVALGGGVVGDIAGFAAATYLRGVKFVQIPTTLLAMVDSSVGGKTAVNLQISSPSSSQKADLQVMSGKAELVGGKNQINTSSPPREAVENNEQVMSGKADLVGGKNQVGAFYQPDLVLCDYETLETLSEAVFKDGCAEVIKHAVIRSAELFELLKQPIMPQIEDIIARNVTIKRDVVAVDEKDTGVRQLLNFGHTVGHGIEKYSGYGVTHGSAVAIGMALESFGEERAKIIEMLKGFGLPYETDILPEQLINAAFSDKKRDGSKITVVSVEKIGESRLKSLKMEELHDYYGFSV
ncbi:MAG: 3-dehydroquinate synthase [Oscillospiraceae bacterium]|nr:3-dehydroquinate synthase [Oscillospiraceae bacterium]